MKKLILLNGDDKFKKSLGVDFLILFSAQMEKLVIFFL
jgi:hypothetical protein